MKLETRKKWIKLGAKFVFFIKLWYKITMFFTKFKGHPVHTYASTLSIPAALDFGKDYRPDPKGFDNMSHPCLVQKKIDTHQMLGDCLPADTLLLRNDGQLVAIADIEVGDKIHDGYAWVKVLKKFDPSYKSVLHFKLNNGCYLSSSKDHRLFSVDGKEIVAENVKVATRLLQPQKFESGSLSLTPDEAYILGAYLAEGWIDGNRIGISGIANSKMLREECIDIAQRNNWHCSTAKRYVRIYLPEDNIVWKLISETKGKKSVGKKLPHLNFTLETIRNIVRAINSDGGCQGRNKTTFVFSTTSSTLAIQYRIMMRMLGDSTHIKKTEKHGGLGKNPIYRVTVRGNNNKRLGAVVKEISQTTNPVRCYDITTESGKIYLPESDVVVHNCDDHAAYWAAALLKSKLASQVWIGFVYFVQEDSQKIAGHAVCIFKDKQGFHYWADYDFPNAILNMSTINGVPFGWQWSVDAASEFNGKPVAAAMIEVTGIKEDDSLKFGKTSSYTKFK